MEGGAPVIESTLQDALSKTEGHSRLRGDQGRLGKSHRLHSQKSRRVVASILLRPLTSREPEAEDENKEQDRAKRGAEGLISA